MCWLKRELNDTALYFPLSSIFGLYLQINTNFLISTQTRQLSLKQKNDSKLGLNLIKRMSYCDYLDRYCIYNMKANGHFNLIFKKYLKMMMMICAEVCIKHVPLRLENVICMKKTSSVAPQRFIYNIMLCLSPP